MKYILALDQGTSSSRAILFDRAGSVVAVAGKEFSQHFPRSGWVEHDPVDLWNSQWETAERVMRRKGISATDISAIAITNQRETTVLWDRRTGRPVCNAIVWQDRRTADYCSHLKRLGHEPMVRRKTGLLLDPYFSATKLKWILDSDSDIRANAEKGHLAFGTVDAWLIWNLTDGAVHATDPGNASRTLLYNIHSATWDEELLDLFTIPRVILPQVFPSSGIAGYTTQALTGTPVPIAGIAGDQQAALFGQLCTSPGSAKNTYGTGCFSLMNIGSSPVMSEHNLLTTVAWQLDDEITYALEGSVFVGGAVVQWLRDGLGFIETAAEVEELALAVPDTGGVYLVPAFTGLGAPYWDPYARGTTVGISRGTTKAHIARAALESIAFQTAELLDCMQKDADKAVETLKVDGGASANNTLMQFQADILQARIERPAILETTALGAAYLAGLAVNFWENIEELVSKHSVDRYFEPEMPPGVAGELLERWREAVKRSRNWEHRSS